MKTTKTKKPIVRRTRNNRSVRGETTPPLRWWRTIPADAFDDSTARILREAIAVIAIIDEPTWHAAASGQVAAAVGLALRLNPQRTSAALYDLIMTALLACAAEGDAAACLAMAHALRRSPGAGRSEAKLATSWLVRSFLKTFRSEQTVEERRR
jgi:hypothetical protein